MFASTAIVCLFSLMICKSGAKSGFGEDCSATGQQCKDTMVCGATTVGRCGCDSDKFHNSSDMCQTKKGYNEPCTAQIECGDTLTCTAAKRCLCIRDQWYNYERGQCREKQGFGGNCSIDHRVQSCWNNMICYPPGLCECKPSQYYNTATATCEYKSGFGQNCSATGQQCKDTMVCGATTVGKCGCDSDKFHNSSGWCQTKKGYNEPCTAQIECEDTLTCTAAERCSCIRDQWYNPDRGQCKEKSGIYGECSASLASCNDTLKCIDGNCQCLPYEYFDYWYDQCKIKSGFGGYCSTTGPQCKDTMVCGATTAGRCGCDSDKFYNSSDLCQTKKGYIEPCSAQIECGDTLTCTAVNRCLCIRDQWYNAHRGQCSEKSGIDGECQASLASCKDTLKCIDGNCQCLPYEYFDYRYDIQQCKTREPETTVKETPVKEIVGSALGGMALLVCVTVICVVRRVFRKKSEKRNPHAMKREPKSDDRFGHVSKNHEHVPRSREVENPTQTYAEVNDYDYITPTYVEVGDYDYISDQGLENIRSSRPVRPDANERRSHGPIVRPDVNERSYNATVRPVVNERRSHNAVLRPDVNERRLHGPIVRPDVNERSHNATVRPDVNERRSHNAMLRPDVNERRSHNATVRPDVKGGRLQNAVYEISRSTGYLYYRPENPVSARQTGGEDNEYSENYL